MRFEEMREWGMRAVAAAEPLDDRLLTATALAILSYGETLVGAVEDAERHRIEAAAIVDAADDSELAFQLDALSHLGWSEYRLGRYADSTAHLERGLAISRGTGNVIYLAHFRQGRSVNLTSAGDLAGALELSEEIIDSARLAANPQALSYGLAAVCWWGSLMGDLAGARRAANESLELAAGFDESSLMVFLGTRSPSSRSSPGTASAPPSSCTTFAAAPSSRRSRRTGIRSTPKC